MFDANLSRRLVPGLADVFTGSVHASVLGPDPEDEAIWNHAKANEFTIVFKDSDFYHMSVAWGGAAKSRVAQDWQWSNACCRAGAEIAGGRTRDI